MKKFLALMLIFTSMGAYSNDYYMPQNCSYGRSAPYDVKAGDVIGAVKSGVQLAQNAKDVIAWANLAYSLDNIVSGMRNLKISAPSHVIQGKSFSISATSGSDIYDNVYFHSSEKGKFGKDETDHSGHANSHTYFKQTHGLGLVWAYNSGLCSAKGVWVQKTPTLSSDSYRYESTYGDYTVPNIRYAVDEFSKAGLDSSLPVKVTLTAFNSRSGSTITKKTVKTFNELSNTIGSLTVRAPTPASGAGLTLTVDDGNFKKAIHLKSMEIPVEPPCRSCAGNW